MFLHKSSMVCMYGIIHWVWANGACVHHVGAGLRGWDWIGCNVMGWDG